MRWLIGQKQVVLAFQRHELRAGNAGRNFLPAGKRDARIPAAVQDKGRRVNFRQEINNVYVGGRGQMLVRILR